MEKINGYCDVCDANFTISHSLDPRAYPVLSCPFCGADLNEMPDAESEEDYED